MNNVDHFSIENKALDVLDRFNISEPVVDVVKITEESGIKVKEVQMPEKYSDVAGFYNEAEKVIYVEINDKPVRKLFTIAHELGHIFLGHKNYDVLFRIPKENALYSKEEMEANSFAAHLLMPDFMVKDYLKKYNLTKGNYVEMSKIFGVPIVTAKMTLEHLRE